LPRLAGANSLETSWKSTVPGEPLPAYDGALNDKARQWVRASAERMLLVYGETDPWSGGALEAPTQASSDRYFAPGRGHGAQISYLSPSDRQKATTAATAMYGKSPSAAGGCDGSAPDPPTLSMSSLNGAPPLSGSPSSEAGSDAGSKTDEVDAADAAPDVP
jgi:hypothetical protein